MTTYLLDANVLIALTVAEHEHHEHASDWAADVDTFAVCPVVEGALIRFLLRLGESIDAASALLHEVRRMPRCTFWPDSLSYEEASLDHIRSHRQVTDAYLASLAVANNGVLATFDRSLAAGLPHAVLLLPTGATST